MNLVIAKTAEGQSTLFVGVSIAALEEYFKGAEGEKYQERTVVYSNDTEYLRPGLAKINAAKEEIRAGKARVIELGPPQRVVLI